MNKNDKNDLEASSLKSKTPNTPEGNNRRDVIKKTIAAGGVTIMASSWTRPVVESIVLPAHAQTSRVSLVAVISII